MNHEFNIRSAAWRTCRVLANRTRLKMFGLVARRPGQTVSAVARAANVTVSAGSQYLRALEAQALLRTRRKGAWVECWPVHSNNVRSGTGGGESAGRLAAALERRLEGDKNAIETAFKLLTAFTHPRRVEVYRALQSKALSLAQLKMVTWIGQRPLLRHLHKLEVRGFIVATHRPRRYAIARHTDTFGRALAHFVLRAL